MIHRALLSVALSVHSGMRIDFHRGAQFRVPHGLLNHRMFRPIALNENLRMSHIFAIGVLITLVHSVDAQEPASSLKQADADYRAGVAALSRNDLNTARRDFEEVVRLAPSAEQGHSALG